MNLRQKLILAVASCLLAAGCIANNENHLFEIGTQYKLTEFTLSFPAGNTFSFASAELDELNRSWNSANVGINTINAIMQKGAPLNYHLTLSDGFKTEFNGAILKTNGTCYLCLCLLGDAGGFPGDVIPHVIQLEAVLNDKRLNELIELLTP